MKPKQYVVILENDDGYIHCVKVCENFNEAYGAAYLALADGIEEEDSYYITIPMKREGESGYVIELRRKVNNQTAWSATVLFYEEDEDE